LSFALSPGQAADDPEGRKLLAAWGPHRPRGVRHVIMDRAYEGDTLRRMIRAMGLKPVVPPKVNRLRPWKYDRKTYRKRNEIERLFRRLKGYRRIFTRFDKLDVMFAAFVAFTAAFDAIR
jgi:transposase